MKTICYQMTRKMWLTMLMAFCIALPALAQKTTVQGTVVDPAGEPLIRRQRSRARHHNGCRHRF